MYLSNKKNIYEWTWLLTTISVVIFLPLGLGIAQEDMTSYLLTSIGSSSGAISVLLVAKLNRWNMPFGLIEVSLWSAAFAIWGAYALCAVFAIAGIGIIFSFKSWTKNQNKKNKKVVSDKNSLSIKELFKIYFISLAAFSIVFFVSLNTTSQPDMTLIIGDSIFAIVLLNGIYLMYTRKKEQWILWIFYNIGMIIWTSILFVQTDNVTSLSALILYGSYLLNSSYGFINWKRS